MTIIQTVQIYCDGADDCPNRLSPYHHAFGKYKTAKEARADLAKQGWISRPPFDMCKECADSGEYRL